MADRGFHSEQFIGAMRRRLCMIRACESVGLCVLIASAGGAVAAGVIRFGLGHVSPVEAVLAAWLLAIGIGLIVAWRRRPTLVQVAMEIDRRLDLHELLSSVLLSDRYRTADPAWHAALAATADVRCREITPAQLALHRMGARSWGGIGLAMALSLVVSLMLATTDPRSSLTGAQASANLSPSVSTIAGLNSHVSMSNPQRPEIETRSQNFTGQDAPDPSSSQAMSWGPSAHDTGGSAAAGSGRTGIGRTPTSSGPPPSQAGVASAGSPQGYGTSAGGGPANSNHQHGDIDTGGASSTTPGHSDTAPWNSANWSSARDAALQAADDGAIPEEYRDLVRDYFQR
jgi:hypothetical protein